MNIKNKIIQFLKQPFIWVILICVLCEFRTYKTVSQNKIYPDSYSYIEASKTINIIKPVLNETRTPIYPYLIKIIRKIGGQENLLNNIAKMQKLLFIIILILFYYCLTTITKNKKIITIFTLIFGISPFIILWNVVILTESISIMEIVILSLLTLLYLKKPNSILSGSIRCSHICSDYDKTSFYLYITNIYFVLDFKVFL